MLVVLSCNVMMRCLCEMLWNVLLSEMSCFEMSYEICPFENCYPVDNFGTVVGENLDCLLLSGTVVGENPDHVCWV